MIPAPRHVPHDELELIQEKVTREGGELRLLTGADYGLAISVLYAEIAPRSGPRRHRHPNAEVFVLHEGEGRYEIEGRFLEARSGDMVIVPPDAWHSFVNTGSVTLRQTAIHQNPRLIRDFEDDSKRG
jgi:mannose-6-phosphate isomerase-like protein (cupin superfamily)